MKKTFINVYILLITLIIIFWLFIGFILFLFLLPSPNLDIEYQDIVIIEVHIAVLYFLFKSLFLMKKVRYMETAVKKDYFTAVKPFLLAIFILFSYFMVNNFLIR